MPIWLTASGKGSRLCLYIVPGTAQTQISGDYNGRLKIKLKAPPQDGEANACLIEFLSKIFKISKKKIHLLSGERSRQKVVLIELSPDTLLTLLSY